MKLVVEKRAGVTLQKSQPNEMRPQPMLERLDAGWVTIPAGHVALLLSVAPEDCAEAAVQVLVNMKDEKYYSVTNWGRDFGVVLSERVSFRTEPAGIPYVSVPQPTSPLIEERMPSCV